MKKLLLALGLTALLAGCASSDNGMGGTSDQYNTTSSSIQYNSNATHGTGTSTATNNNLGRGMGY